MRIGLIHAVQVAIDPINQAFARQWPEAECMNVLDDRLSVDRAKSADLAEDIYDRIGDLADYAVDSRADAVLFTCSAFGPAIEAAGNTLNVPVLKPNEAMFDACLGHGGRIGMLVSFEPSVASMRQEFDELLAARSASATLDVICVPEAMEALRGGDGEHHDALLADAAKSLADCGVIMLGQFSTARAKAAVEAAAGKPVLTSPDTAVDALKRLLG
jgi:Asp/Glu/hydantoin racemase